MAVEVPVVGAVLVGGHHQAVIGPGRARCPPRAPGVDVALDGGGRELHDGVDQDEHPGGAGVERHGHVAGQHVEVGDLAERELLLAALRQLDLYLLGGRDGVRRRPGRRSPLARIRRRGSQRRARRREWSWGCAWSRPPFRLGRPHCSARAARVSRDFHGLPRSESPHLDRSVGGLHAPTDTPCRREARRARGLACRATRRTRRTCCWRGWPCASRWPRGTGRPSPRR